MVRRRKKKNSSGGGAPAWQTTFSDLMSLLLTFFILLFSMSTVSEERFRQAAQSLQAALIGSSADGMLDHTGQSLEDLSLEELESFEDAEEFEVEEETVEGAVIPEEVHELYQTVMGYMETEGIESQVTITRDEEGVYIDIQEAVLFASGSADITSSGQETLGTLAGLFHLFDNEIIIEGHTDDVPIHSAQFPSNWELSTGRAVSVLRYLSESHQLDPTRFSATGYGEFQPVVPNDSDENRALNRRVHMIIVHEERGIK
jgi:chemotaxis protein MotB